MSTANKKSISNPWGNLKPEQQARVALMRFGLGPKPGVAARLAAEDGAAYRACLKELDNPRALEVPDEQVKVYCSDNKGDVVLDYARCCRFGAVFKPFASTKFLPQPTNVFRVEEAIRYVKALEPDVGFGERLVQFWSNHFSVYRSKSNIVLATVGNFERRVIRPNVLGKFSDLLKAVYRHPAMICYLENQYSIGPNSTYAKKNKQKVCNINENLAREILELHTLGIDAGYTQKDVIAFANILTGWNYRPPSHADAGQFYFEPSYHENSEQTVLGVTYQPDAERRGLAVLDALANHPATAQHIAYKLIRHFITDEPKPEHVVHLVRVFRYTGGDLKEMAKALISIPEFWTAPMRRLVQPQPWQLSVIRGMGVTKETILAKQKGNEGIEYHPAPFTLAWATGFTGQYLWGSLTPDGYTDENYFWMNADSIRMRKDLACQAVATSMKYGALPATATPPASTAKPAPSATAAPATPPLPVKPLDPGVLGSAIADDLLYGYQTDATKTALANLESKKAEKRMVLSMLFVSPEYILR